MKTILIAALRVYKRLVSPLLRPSCRYLPTCSEYAMDALERHGTIRGSALAFWRLLRCHPFAHGGYDPVPTPGSRLLTPELHQSPGSHGK